MIYWMTIVSLLIWIVISTGCAMLPRPGEAAEMALLFDADFENGSLNEWKATDPSAWRIEQGRGGKVLAQFKQSDYEPVVRAPRNINLIRNVRVRNFQIELKMRSTTKSDVCDLCVFFGYRDPRHFYYVHLGDNSGELVNTICMVDGGSAVSITKIRTEQTKWDDNWHTVRVVRNVDKAMIEVYFDEMKEPIMTAVSNLMGWGRVGVGSFDGIGQFDDIQLWGWEK
jgi:hypothetical protein